MCLRWVFGTLGKIFGVTLWRHKMHTPFAKELLKSCALTADAKGLIRVKENRQLCDEYHVGRRKISLDLFMCYVSHMPELRLSLAQASTGARAPASR